MRNSDYFWLLIRLPYSKNLHNVWQVPSLKNPVQHNIGGLHDLDIDLSTVTLKTGVSHSRNHHQCGVIGHMWVHREFFTVWGPVSTSCDVGGGGGGVKICLFSLCVCLELSDYWTFLESLLSGAIFINFQATENDLSHAAPDYKCRIHK